MRSGWRPNLRCLIQLRKMNDAEDPDFPSWTGAEEAALRHQEAVTRVPAHMILRDLLTKESNRSPMVF